MPLHPRVAVALLIPVLVLAASVASAQASTGLRSNGWDEDRLEGRIEDGDLDEDDLAALALDPGLSAERMTGEAGPIAGLGSWVSLSGSRRALDSGGSAFSVAIVLGLALERMGDPLAPRTGPAIGDPAPAGPSEASAASSASEAETAKARAWLTPALARGCVLSAWRASGLGPGDARLDALADRARKSALLPETRLRASRRWDDASHTTTITTTDGTSTYDAVGGNLLLEMRLTWRLDRLLFDGDEPALERARLDRQEARARLTNKTLDALFSWARAVLDAHSAVPGSREGIEAELRLAEEEATLDVLTGGWFSTVSPARNPSRAQPDRSAEGRSP